MTSIEAQQAVSGPTPEWLRVPAAELYSGFKKSKLYMLADAGEIKAFALKSGRDSKRGRRFFSRSSIDAYFARKIAEAEAQS